MIFMANAAFALELIALVAGTIVLVRVSKEEVCCKKFTKIVGIFVIVASLLLMICTVYHRVLSCSKGSCDMHDKTGMSGMMSEPKRMDMMMHGKEMMNMMDNEARSKFMKDYPRMKMMMESKEKTKSEGDKD